MVTVGEAEAVPRRQRHQVDMVGKPLTEQRKQFFKQERRGDDSGPCIVAKTVALENLGPTAQLQATVDQRDPVALRAQTQCGRDAAKASANDNGVGHGGNPARG